MKYVTQAKKTEYSTVAEPLYSYKDEPTNEEEWDALKDSKAINKIDVAKEDDLFSMAKKEDKDFEDLSGRIVDIVVKLPLGDNKFKMMYQRGVEVVCLISTPGIVFKNVESGEAINVYKGVVKMFSVKE